MQYVAINLIARIFSLIPPVLFTIAWRRTKELRWPLIPLLVSAALLVISILWHPAKNLFVGPDYSDQLNASLAANLVLIVVLGAYLLFKRSWIAAAAAAILILDWLYAATINSLV